MRCVFALIPVILTLAGCIEGEEETWLERNGSGRLEASYSVPDTLMPRFGGPEGLAKTLKEAAARDQHVDLTRVTHRTEDGRVVFEFAGTFDDLRHLCTFPQRQLRDPAHPDRPVQAEALFGETILDISPRGISFHRTIDISGLLHWIHQAVPGTLKDSTFHYILHLPVGANETNAPVTSNHDRKLEWSFLLRDHATTPMILTAEAPLPLPAWLWPAAALLVLALLSLVVLMMRRAKG